MGLNQNKAYNQADTGTTVMTGIVAGTTTGGPTLLMSKVVGNTLSALVTVEAETNTLTISVKWQVSNDNSTWVDVAPYNNAAFVVWATGTGGDDAVITKMLPLPASAYGWKYARAAVLNLVADGLIADTYRIGYCYEQDQFAR